MRRKLIIALVALLPFCCANAQTNSRMTLLQNSRNAVITMNDGRQFFYIVNSERNYTMYRREGCVVMEGDTFPTADISSIRFKALNRFALDEDSTTQGNNYYINNGLLAFRRTFNTRQWNSLVVPFALTAEQVSDAFGEDAVVASIKGIVEGDVATIEFETIKAAKPRDIVIEADKYYIIRPTREPDVESGKTTTLTYGSDKVAGPLYVIPNVTVDRQSKALQYDVVRSEERNVAIRVRGTYTARDVSPSRNPLYTLNDEGRYYRLTESTPVKAFRSWIEEAVNKNNLEIRFYVDGVGEDLTMPSAIESITAERQGVDTAVYDLSGRRVEGSPKTGIYIVGGRKVVIK